MKEECFELEYVLGSRGRSRSIVQSDGHFSGHTRRQLTLSRPHHIAVDGGEVELKTN